MDYKEKGQVLFIRNLTIIFCNFCKLTLTCSRNFSSGIRVKGIFTVIVIALLVITSPILSEAQKGTNTYSNPDLPPLLQFLDGSKVNTLEDWSRRKEEIRRLMCQYFIGAFPQTTPSLIKAEILQEIKQKDGSVKKKIKLTFDTKNKASFEIRVWMPAGSGPFPVMLIQPRDYQMGWAEMALKRGYMR